MPKTDSPGPGRPRCPLRDLLHGMDQFSELSPPGYSKNTPAATAIRGLSGAATAQPEHRCLFQDAPVEKKGKEPTATAEAPAQSRGQLQLCPMQAGAAKMRPAYRFPVHGEPNNSSAQAALVGAAYRRPDG